MTSSWQRRLADDGFALFSAMYTPPQVEAIARELDAAFATDATGSAMRAADGSVYGARNLLQLWPAVVHLWRPLTDVLRETLGPNFGLVRVLFFDKPPEQSWALPWHKDMTIAVKNNRLPSEHFSKPTFKAGVPHVEAPAWLLAQMLTLRLHLDDMTAENGPLQVMPGSHRGDELGTPIAILGQRGDVLVMRPLLSHCSDRSAEGTTQRRRVLHFEFAGVEALADGFAWHDFVHGALLTGRDHLATIT